MAKGDEQRMAKLIRKLAAKAEQAKAKPRNKYDSTLRPETDVEGDLDRRDFFQEMKKREF